jgi:hypothetical protein
MKILTKHGNRAILPCCFFCWSIFKLLCTLSYYYQTEICQKWRFLCFFVLEQFYQIMLEQMLTAIKNKAMTHQTPLFTVLTSFVYIHDTWKSHFSSKFKQRLCTLTILNCNTTQIVFPLISSFTKGIVE